MTVPTGAWQRDWIPGDRLDVSLAASLADLDDNQLAALAHQNGFAGVSTILGVRDARKRPDVRYGETPMAWAWAWAFMLMVRRSGLPWASGEGVRAPLASCR